MQVYFQSANDETADHLENIFRSWPSLFALIKEANEELDEVMKNVEFSVTRDSKTVGIAAQISHAFFESKVEEELDKKKIRKGSI